MCTSSRTMLRRYSMLLLLGSAWRVLLCSRGDCHSPLLLLSWSWRESMTMHRISWLDLSSVPGNHDTCICRHLLSMRPLEALTCEWASLSEYSKKTQRCTYSQQPVCGPSDSKPRSHLLFLNHPFVACLRKFVVYASRQMHEKPKYYADQSK